MEKAELEKLTRDYQMVQEQVQALAMQKEQFSAQKEEQKEAIDEVGKAVGKVYLNIGGAVVETGKEEATKRLRERQETVEMRLSLVTKQFEEFSKKEKSIREEITNALKSQK